MAKNFDLVLLGPNEVKGGETAPIRAVIAPLDSKTPMRKKMAELMQEPITMSYKLGTLSDSVMIALESMINSRGMYEHSIGEFFLLYGKFEQKYQCDNWKTKEKMDDLLGEDRSQYLKRYKDRKGIPRHHPLPYVVRNILAHNGRNPNRLDDKGQEIKTSIELLKKWVSD